MLSLLTAKYQYYQSFITQDGLYIDLQGAGFKQCCKEHCLNENLYLIRGKFMHKAFLDYMIVKYKLGGDYQIDDLIRDYQLIRVNSYERFITLPAKELSEKAIATLSEWFDMTFLDSSTAPISISFDERFKRIDSIEANEYWEHGIRYYINKWYSELRREGIVR